MASLVARSACRRALAASSSNAWAAATVAGSLRTAGAVRCFASAPKAPAFAAAAAAAPPRFIKEVGAGRGLASVHFEKGESEKELLAFGRHQRKAARLSTAEVARTVVHSATHGVLSTLCTRPGEDGRPMTAPYGSVVFFASDPSGEPVFSFCEMSGHTDDIMRNATATLTVLAPGFDSPHDPRVTLVGNVIPIVGEEAQEDAAQLYREKHPNATWTDFGDFEWYRLEVETANFVGGFAQGGNITAEDYLAAEPDPLFTVSHLMVNRVNEEMEDDLIGMVQAITGLKSGLISAKVLSIDRLGLDLLVERMDDGTESQAEGDKNMLKVRLPFQTPAATRREVEARLTQLQAQAEKAMLADSR